MTQKYGTLNGTLLPEENVVHVWKIALDRPERVPVLEMLLSSDEVERAQRFHFERDRRRFVVARGTVRLILGHYLGVPAAAVKFAYGPQGKPALATPCDKIEINISHSHELALLALTRRRHLGVDVEHIREDLDWLPLTERFFAPVEVRQLQALPERERRVGFYRCWTRKEAYLKARGDGLLLALDSFSVSVGDSEKVTLKTLDDPEEAVRWSLMNLPLMRAYVAALAVSDHEPVRIVQHSYHENIIK